MNRLPLLLTMLLAGCASQPHNAPATAPTQRPLLVHLCGIGGPAAPDRAMVAGIRDGGIDAEVFMPDWTNGVGGVPALLAYERNRAKAERLSTWLVEQRRAAPARRILITAHSGGAGIAVWALEGLPPEVKVDALVLLAPALSPSYDLSRAIAAVRGPVHSFHSPNDGIVLGAGTRWLGTMDRVKTESSGKVGFATPPSADATAYAHLSQHRYDPAWASQYGHHGDHLGWMNQRFAAAILAPLLAR